MLQQLKAKFSLDTILDDFKLADQGLELLRNIEADYLYQNIDRRRLFVRLKQMLGLIFTPEVDLERSSNESSFNQVFEISDLVQIKEIVRDMNIISYATGKLLHLRARAQIKDRSVRLLKQAVREFQKTISGGLKARWTCQELARAFIDLAIRTPIAWECRNHLKRASDTLDQVSRITKIENAADRKNSLKSPWELDIGIKMYIDEALKWSRYRYRIIDDPKGLPFGVALGYARLRRRKIRPIERRKSKTGRLRKIQVWNTPERIVALASTGSGSVRFYHVFDSKSSFDSLLRHNDNDGFPQILSDTPTSAFLEDQLHTGTINCLKHLRNRYLLTAGDAIDSSIVLYDIEKSSIIYRLQVSSLHEDEKKLDEFEIGYRVLSLDAFLTRRRQSSPRRDDSEPTPSVGSRLVPKYNLMATGDSDGDVVIRRLWNGEMLRAFHGAHGAAVKEVAMVGVYFNHSQAIGGSAYPVSFTSNLDDPRCRRVVFSTSDDYTIKCWDIHYLLDDDADPITSHEATSGNVSPEEGDDDTGSVVLNLKNRFRRRRGTGSGSSQRSNSVVDGAGFSLRKISSLVFKSWKGDEASTGYSYPVHGDLEVYDNIEGCLLRMGLPFDKQPDSHSGPVECIVVSEDFVITGSADRCVRLWRVFHQISDYDEKIYNDNDEILEQRAGRWHGLCMHVLEGHCGPVLSIAIAPIFQVIISASADSSIRIWTLPGEYDLLALAEMKLEFDEDESLDLPQKSSSFSRRAQMHERPLCVRILEGHTGEVISLHLIEWQNQREEEHYVHHSHTIESVKPHRSRLSSRISLKRQVKRRANAVFEDRLSLVSGSTDNRIIIWHF